MSSLIQGLPTGLLDLLGIKSTGRNPRLLLDEVRPVVDIFSLYSGNRLEPIATSAALAAVGDGATITVPAGEAWDLIGYEGGFFVTAGSIIAGSEVSVGVTVQGSFIRMGTHASAADCGAGEGSHFAQMVPRRMLMPPGSNLRVRFDNDGGASTFTDCISQLSALITRLSV